LSLHYISGGSEAFGKKSKENTSKSRKYGLSEARPTSTSVSPITPISDDDEPTNSKRSRKEVQTILLIENTIICLSTNLMQNIIS
jgi:hypothetical protein